MRVDVVDPKDTDSELRQRLLSKDKDVSTFRKFLQHSARCILHCVGCLFLALVLFCIIFSFMAYFENGAGERIRADPDSCTTFPHLYISFIVASLIGIALIPCCFWCQEKDSAITYCWVGIQQIFLFVTMLIWVLESYRINGDDECKTYVQEVGSDLFWHCCTLLAKIFAVALSFETTAILGQCLTIVFCTS